MKRSRRDAEAAGKIEAVWRRVRGVGNLVFYWRREQTEAALVVADALVEQGFPTVGNDLSRFAKRMQQWKDYQTAHGAIQWRSYGYVKDREDAFEALGKEPKLPKWEQWTVIKERADAAIKAIAKKTPTTREWHHHRPHQAMVIFERRWTREGDRIEGPYPITPRDVEDITTIRKWWAKQGYPPLGKVHNFWIDGAYQPFTRVGSRIILHPNTGPWHTITIEPGQTRRRARGREIVELAEILTEYGFTRPNLYARMLSREGSGPQDLDTMLAREGVDAVARRYNFHRTLRGRR